MTGTTSKPILGLAFVAILCLSSNARAQDEVARGHELYLQHCGPCHGVKADGHGPLEPELKTPAADLRFLSTIYGYPLPADQIARFMDGRADVAAHGPRDMPVWGEEMWQYPEGQGNSNQVSDSVAAIVSYLQTIQIRKRRASIDPQSFLFVLIADNDVYEGHQLFLRYCAACHGEDGTGNGPVAKTLRDQPANLRLLADKFGMPLPTLALADLIDGRKAVRAHGTHEMPIWGERLYQTHEGNQGERGIGETIRKIVAYLETIQDHRTTRRLSPSGVNVRTNFEQSRGGRLGVLAGVSNDTRICISRSYSEAALFVNGEW